MNAEIYYLDERPGYQQSSPPYGLAELVAELQAQIYPGLNVTLRPITLQGEREAAELGRQYVKLLQASIRPDKGFTLDITVLEHSGYRFYIYVYYAFAYHANKKFQESHLRVFFPAVAVRNRMALVPAGLGKELERDWNEQLTSPFKPLAMGGAAEVSFGDPAAVKEAVAQVAQTTRDDLLQEIRAYASHHNPADIDQSTIARDLKIDVGYLQHLFATGGIEHAFHNQLTCEIAPKKIAFDRWTKVILSVRNDSDVSLSNLQAKISGPVEILPTRIRINVPARSTASVPISLSPIRRGEFPLEIVLALPDEEAFSSWLPAQPPLWLECE
jgi:hypothetical protein